MASCRVDVARNDGTDPHSFADSSATPCVFAQHNDAIVLLWPGPLAQLPEDAALEVMTILSFLHRKLDEAVPAGRREIP
jgi:hypothetical protein